MSFLIMDVDNSLSSIGGYQRATEIAGIPPTRVIGGYKTIGLTLAKIFSAVTETIKHPLSDDLEIITYKPNRLAEEIKLDGIVIDTISHLFRQDLRLLEEKNKSERMEMQDWGTLERKYNKLFQMFNQLPIWTIMNSHLVYEKNDEGRFYYGTALKGASKDFIYEYFDIVMYTKITTINGKIQYNWITKPEGLTFAKDRLDVLEPVIPQDFAPILKAYKDAGCQYPKILVIGQSGTGKSRAISTIPTTELKHPAVKTKKSKGDITI